MRSRVWLASLLLPMASPVDAELVMPSPRERCAYCHGEHGEVRSGSVPALAGQPAAYVLRQLKAYRSGLRPDPEWSMRSAAGWLEPEEARELAAHYAGRARPDRSGPAADARSWAEGRRRYEQGRPGELACVACHRPGNGSATPWLEGQNARYLAAQLRAYRAGVRRSDPGGVMRAVASALSDEDITALAAFLTSEAPRETGK